MYPNPLIYCTCLDPWNLGPRKLIKTPHPLPKTSTGKPKQALPTPVSRERNYLLSQPIKPVVSPKDKAQTGKPEESSKLLSTQEVIDVSPGYKLIRNREQISVTLGDEMFNRKKHTELDVLNKIKFSRTDIISDLEEQISELTAIIEQMNRDHQSAQKLLSNEMDLRCTEMKQKFENEIRDLKKAHKEELEKLESSYKDMLKVEKAAAQEKLEEMSKEYKYLKNMFHMYQDSIYDEMEDKWSKRKAEWEKDEKLEREKILLQQKHRITKKFELESEEEKKKMNESFSAVFENFNREKEELIKQHDEDVLQIQELKKSKEILEAELRAQTIVLETLNTNLYHCQLELQREKTILGNLEKLFQTKLAETEEKYKYTIQTLTEENTCLRQQIATKSEEMSEERSEKSAFTIPYVHEPDSA
ncbi:flagellum-associated coiled-coil domain-containing protein 1 isoform X1 [Mesocricetus auratus]|uniref:Flagellum-associated coiled-coil domain-containing protein 1 isoform X1 n=1 Tax=Mesocricetus auratus TaxID=10036 RepID=A0ABM2Y3Q1_MESAU|nr:flagellum-associated coiled-coil domain-containing protein 1 isoform X1 [Mesocricetus auratus]XP_040609483.1 flagellum-associated coiled-coil domain-containing protein 1 isoform X1 [Mesocricetus auratus]XP_040609484.1 flagellum-associated coiled-coil domain-containing protein 1 isoform X1 [Mesocricetus auratus]XP_040609485.1 flagellum-associated coiled-coil domain-containing protein 1 isoform X1 [Mesocricetus auratus]XP_040609486.1 flagellum-associated coiled-coil domain-containing protein 1